MVGNSQVAPFSEQRKPAVPKQGAQGERPLATLGDPQSISSFALDQAVGLAPVSLPASITGAAITALLSYDPERAPHRLRNTIAPLIFCLALTLLLQMVMLGGVASIVIRGMQEGDRECHDGLLALHIGCHAVFIITMILSLRESFEMHRWLNRIPRTSKYAVLKLQKAQQGLHQFYMPAEGVGMTRKMRCCIYLLVLLPRAFVSVMILIFGSAYVLGADSDADLLLDCVGMVFVADIDGLIFRFALSSSQMTLLTSTPPIGLSAAAYRAHRLERFVEKNSTWLAVGTLIVLLPFLEFVWCSSLLVME